MHEYSIDARRNKILFYLSLLAIALASTISALLHNLPFVTITIPVTSFTFFYYLYGFLLLHYGVNLPFNGLALLKRLI